MRDSRRYHRRDRGPRHARCFGNFGGYGGPMNQMPGLNAGGYGYQPQNFWGPQTMQQAAQGTGITSGGSQSVNAGQPAPGLRNQPFTINPGGPPQGPQGNNVFGIGGSNPGKGIGVPAQASPLSGNMGQLFQMFQGGGGGGFGNPSGGGMGGMLQFLLPMLMGMGGGGGGGY